jgi:CheY-like chemotaxis protein
MSKAVLAVDDSPSIRQMVAFTLKNSGYDVVEAATAWTDWPRPRPRASTWC